MILMVASLCEESTADTTPHDPSNNSIQNGDTTTYAQSDNSKLIHTENSIESAIRRYEEDIQLYGTYW